MALRHEDESNEYRLLFCKKCNDPYPAIMLDDHEEVCKKFMELISFDDDIDYGAIADAAEMHKDNRAGQQNAFDESCEETLCGICQRNISNLMFADHQVFCQVLMEQYAGYEALRNLKTVPVDNDAKNSPTHRYKDNSKQTLPQSIPVEQKVYVPVEKTKEETREEGQQQNPRKAAQGFKVKAEVRDHNVMSNSIPEGKEIKKPENLSFGKDKDQIKDFLKEQKTFIMPNNPLLNCIDQTETEDLSDLSDDDCDEYIEDFWKKARDVLNRRRMQNV